MFFRLAPAAVFGQDYSCPMSYSEADGSVTTLRSPNTEGSKAAGPDSKVQIQDLRRALLRLLVVRAQGPSSQVRSRGPGPAFRRLLYRRGIKL